MKRLGYALLAGCLVLAAGGLSYSALMHCRYGQGNSTSAQDSDLDDAYVKFPRVKRESVTENWSENGSYTLLKKGVYYTNRVVVVTFHDISTNRSSPWSISPQLFQADLDALERNGFHVISNRQFIGWLEHRNAIPPNAVLLTFDDGYQSMYTEALPILLRHHMTGTFFVIVGRQDQGSPGFMSWRELKVMVRDGMTVESHTYNSHYEVTVVGTKKKFPVFDTAIIVDGKKETEYQTYLRDYWDFKRAKDELQAHLGEYVNEFAWPYGWGTQLALKAAEAAGYQFIFTTKPEVVTSKTNPYAIPRIDIGYPAMSPEQAIQDILRTAEAHASPQRV